MLQSILSNLAVILIMHLCVNFTLIFLKDKVPKILLHILVILFISSASISMFYLPIKYEGYWFDLRLVPLGFVALLRGWKDTVPVLAIVCMWRWGMGGAGMVPGILFGMLLPTIFALVCYIGETAKLHVLKVWIFFSVMWFISDFPIIIWFPNGWEVFMMIAPLRYIAIIGSALILYFFVISSIRQNEIQRKLKFFAEHDPLTEMYNLRKFFNLLEVEYKKKKPVTYLVLVDIDYFKKINDTYGHIAGDGVLRRMADVFLQACKAMNSEGQRAFVARYGGEEFILYVSCTSMEYFESWMEQIRKTAALTKFQTDEGELLPSVTISIGCAELSSIDHVQQTLRYADQSLYEVKNSGRNSIRIYKGGD